MGNTTGNALPYPEPTDPIAEGADAIRELAEKADTTFAGRAVGTPTSTSSDGTPSVASNTIRDDVLGSFHFVGLAGHLYRVILDGFVANGTVAGDSFSVGIRNGGASVPSGTSPLIGSSTAYVPGAGSAGRVTVPVAYPFATTGDATLAVTYNRRAGSGVLTPVGARALYVVDLGYFPVVAAAFAALADEVDAADALDVAALAAEGVTS